MSERLASRIEEIRPGLFHWTTMHPHIHAMVSSYWLDGTGVLIDPLLPSEEDLDWFASRVHKPSTILLSSRHHYRDSSLFVERFGCSVFCNRAGLYEFTASGSAGTYIHGDDVKGFDVGAHLPGPAIACEMGAICDDDTVFYLPGYHALVFADGVVKGPSDVLGFVPPTFMDNPEETEEGLLASCNRLLEDDELSFKHLLLAHGGPVMDNGRELLQDLADAGGRTAFEF